MAERKLEIVFLGNAKPAQEAMQQLARSGDGLQAKIGGLEGAFSVAACIASGLEHAVQLRQVLTLLPARIVAPRIRVFRATSDLPCRHCCLTANTDSLRHTLATVGTIRMDDARPLVSRLFDFLEAFNQKRNPVVREVTRHEKVWWWSNLPASSHVARAEFEDISDNGGPSGDDDGLVLKVTRPQIPEAPRPPVGLGVWLDPGWDDPTREASWSGNRDDPELGHIDLDPDSASRLVDWKQSRDLWAVRVKEDFVALRLFQWLWDVHATLQREGERYELAVGDGILSWESGGVPAMHPLLIQRLQLEYDPNGANGPTFTVVEADRPPELYAGLLRALGVDPMVVGRLLETVERERPHPLGAAATDDFLRRAAGELHPEGQYRGFADPPPSRAFPQIVRAPVLFMRTRALGFEAAIQAIKEDLADGGEIPESLSALVGVHPSLGADIDVVDPFEQGDEAKDVLLTKEANREQLEIARRLSRYGAVLVQGPPGTGKTHTIANLIGHLLANGKTVLVTSHTTKALRVLRDKVVPELQPLCVSVLEGDAAGNQQLKDAVTEIGRRLSSSSEDQLAREAEQISARRQQTLADIRRARTRLLDSVQGEYSAIVIAGKEYSPIEAAKKVRTGSDANSWIPGQISSGVPLPLSSSEVRMLYASNEQLSSDDLRDISGSLPDPSGLPAPAEFERTHAERERLSEFAGFELRLWREGARDEETLQSFAAQMREAYAGLAATPRWYRTALDAAVHGDDEAKPWQLLLGDLQDWVTALRGRRLAQQTHAVSLGAASRSVTTLETVERILVRLRSGKSLARVPLFMRREWKRLIEQVTVLGERPATVAHFEALREVLLPEAKLLVLKPRWEALMTPLGEPLPDGTMDAEGEMRPVAEKLQDALERRPALIRSAAEQARHLGFDLDEFLPPKDASGADWWAAAGEAVAARIQPAVDAECVRLRLSAMAAFDKALIERLSTFSGHADPNRPVGQLLNSILSGVPADYGLAYERLKSLHERRAVAEQRATLLSRLSAVAPEWAEAISNRRAPHDRNQPPGDPAAAWEWKQLQQALDSRKGPTTSNLIAEIRELRRRLRDQTTELIDRRSWAMQAKNTDPADRQALSGYVELVKKIGKGTGRRAARLREAARQHMSVARRAVPVWIAPLARVAEAFDPRTQRFDVVIIDEASQADALGLIAWYLGKSVIVVGDDQQVTPDSVGDRIDDMTSMIDTYLRGIPNRELYDGQASVYQLASTAFRGVVRLREHFRCVPDIISFSNSLAYGGEIIPLREPSSARVGPPVVSYRVQTGPANGSKVNEEEARIIAALLAACLEQPEYRGLTFGVVSLLGAEQSLRIEQLLRNVVPPNRYQESRILCGAPPHFQGDERDVVFLSMVDRPPETPPLPLRGDAGERFKKRYNVAASRAKDQLWVVHSLDHQRDLKTEDLRWRLLQWAADPASASRTKADAISKAESPFEEEVIRRLVDAGYRVKPQYAVGAYRIDIVVEGESSRIAVECDGAAFHSSTDQIRSDLDRQALLERTGWQFYRVRGSDFYRDPEAAFRHLIARLDELGIRPLGQERQGSASGTRQWNELLERVKQRASELLSEWLESSPGTAEAWDTEEPDGLADTGGRFSDSRRTFSSEPEKSPVNGPAVVVEARRQADVSPEPDRRPERQARLFEATQVGPHRQPQAREASLDNDGDLARVTSAAAAAGYFRAQGLRVEDKRPKGGALWVFGSRSELAPAMRTLERKGIKFLFSEKRSGWFLKER
ncbi:MAG: AAA domain-containing protein [Hyphomicrobiales bacterium]